MALALVTGGAGFIGSHVVAALVRRGDRVRVVDDLATGRRDAIDPAFLADGRVELVIADLAAPGVAEAAVQGVQDVFHLAAVASVPRTVADPVGSDRSNVGGTVALLSAAARAGVHHLVFSSSSAVYGDSPSPVQDENDPPRPTSPYAVQKLAGEQYAAVFSRLHGLHATCLRYFNVFGAGQSEASGAIVPRWLRRLADGAPLEVFGDGLQTRDFVPVEDVVAANLAAAGRNLAFDVVNVGRGEPVTLVELGHRLARALGTHPVFDHRPERPGDLRHSAAAVRRLREGLGVPSGDLDAAFAAIARTFARPPRG